MQLTKHTRTFPLFICLTYFISYLLLGVIKHNHYLSGYDLAIVDQVVWKYSQFLPPITTVHSYTYMSLLADHFEIIYILLTPFYWIYNNPLTLILLQAVFIACSGFPVYLIAKKFKLAESLSLALMVTYLSFYGIQNAVWSDVHSLVFAAGILPWFVWFLYAKKTKWLYLSLFLALLCKEDIGLLTFCIGLVFFLRDKSKQALIIMLVSALYVLGVLFVYFPVFTPDGYRYASQAGFFADLKLTYLFDTPEKISVYGYSLGWFGFLPLLGGLYLLPALADLFHYFVFGHALVTSAQGLFLHYRVTLALLLVWPTIVGLSWFYRQKLSQKIPSWLVSGYLILCAGYFQYTLHTPLSYLTKAWFWQAPKAQQSIREVMRQIPQDASLVTQINLAPHLTHRANIFTLWPEARGFEGDSPCGLAECRWLKWRGNPDFLFVDVSDAWDIRHFLANREDFISGLDNMEKMGVIKLIIKQGTTKLYKINQAQL